MGNLVFQATLGGQVNLVGPNTASTFNLNVPAVAGTLVTTGDTGTVTNTMLAGSIANAKLSNSSVTVGSTSIALGATSTTLAGLTGVTSSVITDSGLTSGRVTYASTGGLLADSANLTFNGTTLTTANDASISGLTVGKGGGSASTNTVVGTSALQNNTSGTNHAAFGTQALQANTTGAENSAFGLYALLSNTTGSSNVGLGRGSLQSNTTASNNTAVGYQAGYSNTTGGAFTAIGYQAGYSHTTGNFNTFIGGRGCGYSVTTGEQNTFVGDYSGRAVTTGGQNTLIGQGSGYLITTGSKNTILGVYSGNAGGLDIRTSSNYIVLSDGDGNPRGYFDSNGSFVVNGTAANAAVTAYSTSTNQAFWGKSTVSGSPTSVLWNSGTSGDNSFETFYTEAGATLRGSISFNRAGGLVSYNATSDYRAKTVNGIVQNALSKVALLKPSTGRMNGATQDIDFFVAHELQEVVPSAVTGEKDAVNEDNTPKYQMVDKSALIPLLTAAIQELKAEFDAYKATHP